jgi:tRNA nucleotidyltransferase (CCA-adding enzyme)
VYEEFKKLVTKGIEPGKALDFLYTTGWSENFPEIHDLKNVPQNPEFHPEGSVDAHTAHVMNEAARIADRENLSPEDREVLIFSALAHDFAKSTHTSEIIDKNGNKKIVSPGHEKASGPMARSFLESIGVNKKIINQVIPLVENHMQHIVYDNSKYKDSFVKKLSEKLHPSNIKMLNHLIESDHSGRPPLKKESPIQSQNMVNLAKMHGIYQNKISNLIEGKDVIKYLGGTGSPMIGEILNEQRNLILNHSPEMNDRQSALNWLDRKMRNKIGFINGNDVINITGVHGPAVSLILDKAWQLQKQGKDKQHILNWLKTQIV